MSLPNLNRRRLALAALAAGGLTLTGCDQVRGWFGASDLSFHNVDITGADYARNFALPDHDGGMRTLDDFRGQVVVVFFGFTQCPDVCPATMAEMAQIKQSLGADGERVRTLFITVDPQRDTPALLREYMSNFGPGFTGLVGTPEQTAAVAKEFKVYYRKVPGRSESSYTMDHTAGSYVFDPAGKVRLFVRHGTGTEALAADIRQLLKTG